MTILATVMPDAGSILAWLVVGLVPGFLAARVYRGGRHGPAGDAVVALAGAAAAVAAGALVWALGPAHAAGMPLVGSLLAAALSATAVVLAIQWLGPQPRPVL